MADQTWQFRAFPAPDGEAAAVSFLNEPDRQGRGEGAALAGARQPRRQLRANLAIQGLPRS